VLVGGRRGGLVLLVNLLRARRFCFWTNLRVVSCGVVFRYHFCFTDHLELGLDAYNAFNVIESLTSLARDYNRTVVFTIHQPRSNIVSLFDRLILLAQGKLVYSGEIGRAS